MPEYKYVGKDRFYGIPARDLTAEEFEALSPDLKRHVIANDSYKEVPAKKVEPLKGDGDKE